MHGLDLAAALECRPWMTAPARPQLRPRTTISVLNRHSPDATENGAYARAREPVLLPPITDQSFPLALTQRGATRLEP